MVRRSVASAAPARRRMPIQERRGSRVAHSMMMPPPVHGWNAKDSLGAMKPTEAVSLVNWFPKQSTVSVRPGYSSHCDTATAAKIVQMIPFEYASHAKMLACSSDTIYEVSTSSPSTLASSLSNGFWSFDYLGGLVLMANGADVVKSYNGTAIASPAFTGVTLSNLDQVSVYKSRAYFVEENTQSMWYGGVGSVSGTLTEFDFSSVASVRGNLVFTSHLKGDGGDGGQDDLFVAVFADGDVLAYSGSDPGDAADWALLGHYRIGRPVSRLSFAAASDDIYIITSRGYEKLSEVVRYGGSTPKRALLSYNIQQAVIGLVKTPSVGGALDWRVNIYQGGQMLIMTVPISSSVTRHHVQNINTGAWCEFRSINTRAWAVLQGSCYFGHISDGVVYAFDDGSGGDNGSVIRADGQPAWTDLKYGSRNKSVQLIRPYFYANYKPSVSLNAGSDYNPINLTTFATGSSPAGTVWDQGVWDVATWPEPFSTRVNWAGKNALGKKIGFRVAVDANPAGGGCEWNDTEIIYTTGGLI